MKSFSKLSSSVKAAADVGTPPAAAGHRANPVSHSAKSPPSAKSSVTAHMTCHPTHRSVVFLAGTKLAAGAGAELLGGAEALGLSPRASTDGSIDDQLRSLFGKIDADGSGSLDRDEVAALAQELGLQLSAEELDQAMAEMDADGNGDIDYDEFSSWWLQGRASEPGTLGGAAADGVAGGGSPSALRGKFLTAHSKVLDATISAVEQLEVGSNVITSTASTRLTTSTKFLSGTVRLATRSVKDVLEGQTELRVLFDKIDVDGNGSLDKSEVEAVATHVIPTTT